MLEPLIDFRRLFEAGPRRSARAPPNLFCGSRSTLFDGFLGSQHQEVHHRSFLLLLLSPYEASQPWLFRVFSRRRVQLCWAFCGRSSSAVRRRRRAISKRAWPCTPHNLVAPSSPTQLRRGGIPGQRRLALPEEKGAFAISSTLLSAMRGRVAWNLCPCFGMLHSFDLEILSVLSFSQQR